MVKLAAWRGRENVPPSEASPAVTVPRDRRCPSPHLICRQSFRVARRSTRCSSRLDEPVEPSTTAEPVVHCMTDTKTNHTIVVTPTDIWWPETAQTHSKTPDSDVCEDSQVDLKRCHFLSPQLDHDAVLSGSSEPKEVVTGTVEGAELSDGEQGNMGWIF